MAETMHIPPQAQEASLHPSCDEQVRAWARAIITDQTPVKGGFAPVPVFPIASQIHQAAKTLKGHRLG